MHNLKKHQFRQLKSPRSLPLAIPLHQTCPHLKNNCLQIISTHIKETDSKYRKTYCEQFNEVNT